MHNPFQGWGKENNRQLGSGSLGRDEDICTNQQHEGLLAPNSSHSGHSGGLATNSDLVGYPNVVKMQIKIQHHCVIFKIQVLGS